MADKYVLDSEGNPVPCDDLMAWARWIETADRTVAKDCIGDTVVSTVFLGLDHSFNGEPPLLWETMVFGGPHDGNQGRYASLTEAKVGHADAVAAVKGAQ